MSFSVIEREFIYSLKLSFRKTIPSNKGFYILFFLVKFFPLILMTHVIDPETPGNLFTLSKIIKSLTLVGNLKIKDYLSTCIVIYVIILLLLTLLFSLSFIYYSSSKKTDFHLYGIPNNDLRIGHFTETLVKFTTGLFLVVIFFYQHLIDILYFGMFKLYTNVSFSKDEQRIQYNYSSEFIIGILNALFILILMLLMYLFFFISSTNTVKCSFGYQSGETLISNIFNIFYFSLQGPYTSSCFYTDKSDFNVMMCIVLIIVLLLDYAYTINSTKNYFSDAPIPLLMSIIKNSCLFSSILEIYIYYLISFEQRNSQKYYFLKLIGSVSIGSLITWINQETRRRSSFKKLARDFFSVNSNTKQSDITEYLFDFFIRLEAIPCIKDKLILILKLIQEHQTKCNSKNCQCREIKSLYINMEDGETFEKIMRIFLLLGERKINNAIMKKGGEEKGKKDGNLLLIHCDFLYAIKKRFHVALYLSQLYLYRNQTLLKFRYSYFLYEINYLIYHQKKTKSKSPEVSFFKENLENEKIMGIVLFLVERIEKILMLKTLQNTNSKIELTCEDFLQPISEFVKEDKKLMREISKIVKKYKFGHSAKTKFLVYYYLKLFNITLPKKIKPLVYSGNSVFPSYDSVLGDFLNKKNNYVIASLTINNKFIIQYASTILAEELHYTVKEMIGADIHDILIPKFISKYHEIYLKEFILLGNKSYKKKTFILNKKFQMHPVEISCRVVPTINNLYSIVFSCQPIVSEIYSRYDILLDTTFNILYISEGFEKQFFFTMKMLNSLKINFCEFFGLNKDALTKYFSSITRGFITTPQPRQRYPLAPTSYRPEELNEYQTIDFSRIYNPNVRSLKEETVSKEKVENYLLKLGKSIEELGLEKEWKLLISVLYDKIKRKDASGVIMPISEYKHHKSKIDNNFYIQIEFKQMGPVQYFSSTIREIIDNSFNNIAEEKNRSKKYLRFGDEFNAALRSGNLDGLFMNLKQKQSRTYNAQYEQSTSISPTSQGKEIFSFKTNPSINQTTGENSINNSNANFLVTGNESNISRIVNNINLNPKKTKPKQTAQEKEEKLQMIKANRLEKETKKFHFLRVLQVLLGITVLILNIVNLTKNFSAIEYAMNIFNANAYSYCVLNDILFGCLCCINSCFIQEGIQEGDDQYQSQLIESAAAKVIDDYQHFNYHVTNVIGDKNLRPLYKTLNEEDEYLALLSNWKVRRYNSTLVDEIYLIYHSFKIFVSSNEANKSNCRLKEFFFSNKYVNYLGTLDPKYSSTTQERFAVYTIYNVLTTIVQRIEKDNIQLSNFFQLNNKNSKQFFLTLNITILIVCSALYFLMTVSINKARKLFKGRFKQILFNYPYEEIFLEDVQKFKALIEDFNRNDANEYSNYKNCIHSTSAELKEKLSFSKVASKKFGSSRSNIMRLIKKNSTRKSKRESKKYRSYATAKKEKEKEEVKKEEEEEREENGNKKVKISKQTRFIFLSFVVLILVFGIFIGIEIAIILTNNNFFETFYVGHLLASNFLWRIPKLEEMLLYTYASVILDNAYYIKKNVEDYKNSVYCNYYNLEINFEDNSFYQLYGGSNFAYLYYQLSIISETIKRYTEGKTNSKLLKETSRNNDKYSKEKDLCLHSNYVYYSTLDNNLSLTELFSLMSSFTQSCRKVGNGLNLSGLRESFNLMTQQLSYLFSNFVLSKEEDKGVRLLQDNVFLLILKTNNIVFGRLNSSTARSIIQDISSFTKENKNLEILVSVISIIFSCVIMLTMLWVILLKLERTNKTIKVVVHILNNFNKNIDI